MLKLQAPEEPRVRHGPFDAARCLHSQHAGLELFLCLQYIGPVPPLSRGEELAVPRRGQLPLMLTKDVLRGMPLYADEGCPRSDGFAGVWQARL